MFVETDTHTHTLTRTACTPCGAELNVRFLMLTKFLSRSLAEEHCQADSCSNSTFPRMWSQIGNSGERLPGMDSHKHTQWKRTFTQRPTCTSLHMRVLTHIHIHVQGGAWRAWEGRCHGLIIEGCPLKMLHTRAQKIKVSYQWGAHPKKEEKNPPPSYSHFSPLFDHPPPMSFLSEGLKF